MGSSRCGDRNHCRRRAGTVLIATPLDNQYQVKEKRSPTKIGTFRLTVTNRYDVSSTATLNVTAGRAPSSGSFSTQRLEHAFDQFLPSTRTYDDVSSLPLTYTFVHDSKADGTGTKPALW